MPLTGRALRLVFASALCAALVVPTYGASIDALMDQRVEKPSGVPIGYVDEFIVDVEAGRVLYVVVDAGRRYHTLPVRAIVEVTARNTLQLDMALVDAAARIAEGVDARFRRAGRLIGQDIALPGDGHRGTIHDVHFEPETGLITHVVIATKEGKQNFPARTLLGARFPPAMQ